MAIRKLFFLSLVAAGAAQLGVVSSAEGQQPGAPRSATSPEAIAAGLPEELSTGLIMSADHFQLAPGETIVSGDPELGIGSGAYPGTGYPHHEGEYPGPMHEHPPMLAPPPAYGMATECPGCESGHYVTAEALYFKREDEFFTRSTAFALREMDYEWAGRLTIGRRFDCVNGYEAIYAGPHRWEEDRTATDPLGGIFTSLNPVPPLLPADLSAFNNAVSQRQNFQADLDSLEFNRTYFGWDVVKALIGIRTMLYDEEYNYTSENNLGQLGRLRQKSDNFLVGPQVGLELYYPLANRVSIGSKIKGALLVNFFDSESRLVNNGTFVAGGSDDDTEISGFGEIGTNLTYRVTDTITASVGYELWYLSGVATSYQQVPVNYRANQGSRDSAEEDVLFHGATAGVQINF